jgi:hypothetical protein
MKKTSALTSEERLLTRGEFKRQVFLRSRGKCVFCSRDAVDAHHILERKLFVDGGYYASNGAAVCEAHHWQCETTQLSVETVRAHAGINQSTLPAGLLTDVPYDKWGNRIWPSGLRSWGPLENDSGARKALAAGGVLGLMLPADYREA